MNLGMSQAELDALIASTNPKDSEDSWLDDTEKEVVDWSDITSDDVATLKFGEDIKILLIATSEFRLICHFLGCQSPKDVQSTVYKHATMIGQLNQQCLVSFMESQGFDYAGEIMFDNGEPIPVSKQTWNIKGKEVSFTNIGYRFFEKKDGEKKDNIVAFCWTDSSGGQAGLTFYSNSQDRSKQYVEKLEEFTKKNNCIRGAKLRDVNVAAATFSEVHATPDHNWDNYYFPQNIREMFELEVFGFLKATDRYNKLGISKRGLLTYGPPGTGKTTLGKIICNEAPDSTVILITPDLIAENNTGKHSVKMLYLLADFVSPAVIFLEDLDLFSEDREGVVDHLALGALMNILDGVNQVKNAVTVATTNRLELIEKALSNRPGRFDRVVEVPVMPSELRKKMFTNRLDECHVDNGVIDEIVKISKGWTGAQCQEFVNSMNLFFINNNQDDKRHVTLSVVSEVKRLMDSLSRSTQQRKAGFHD